MCDCFSNLYYLCFQDKTYCNNFNHNKYNLAQIMLQIILTFCGMILGAAVIPLILGLPTDLILESGKCFTNGSFNMDSCWFNGFLSTLYIVVSIPVYGLLLLPIIYIILNKCNNKIVISLIIIILLIIGIFVSPYFGIFGNKIVGSDECTLDNYKTNFLLCGVMGESVVLIIFVVLYTPFGIFFLIKNFIEWCNKTNRERELYNESSQLLFN